MGGQDRFIEPKLPLGGIQAQVRWFLVTTLQKLHLLNKPEIPND